MTYGEHVSHLSHSKVWEVRLRESVSDLFHSSNIGNIRVIYNVESKGSANEVCNKLNQIDDYADADVIPMLTLLKIRRGISD